MYTTIRHEPRHARKAWPGTLVDPLLWSYLTQGTRQTAKPNLKVWAYCTLFLSQSHSLGWNCFMTISSGLFVNVHPCNFNMKKTMFYLPKLNMAPVFQGENILSFALELFLSCNRLIGGCSRLIGGCNRLTWLKQLSHSAGILEQSMGARNWVGIGLSYPPARARICKRIKSSVIDSKESISGLLKRFKVTSLKPSLSES